MYMYVQVQLDTYECATAVSVGAAFTHAYFSLLFVRVYLCVVFVTKNYKYYVVGIINVILVG